MKKIVYPLLATAILTACGGSSKKEEPTPPPKVNKAPIAVADTGLIQNNIPLTLNVLANDSDNDNDTITISQVTSQPANGSVEIVSNELVYTPNNNFAGTDSLTYQISDGELTAEADVALTINHTMTLSGKVTDSPIASAKVVVEIGGETFEATADEEGNYQLPLVINDMNAMLVIRATGSADNNQDNVELIVIAGGVETLLEQVNDDRALTNEESNITNATHVSTATYLLVKDRINGEEVSSNDELEQLKSEVSATELIETAAFIKLLIDNDAFAIPEGETVVTALEKMTGAVEGEEVSTADAIQGYLEDNNLIDENGEPTQAYTDALEIAKAETIADPNVVEQFTADMISGKKIIQLSGAKVGWHEYNGVGWAFNSDNTATQYRASQSSLPEAFSQANWSVNEGKIELAFDANNGAVSVIYLGYPFDGIVTDWGFDASVQQALIAAVDAGTLASYFNTEMITGYANQTITLLSKTDNVYQVAVSGDYVTTLIMPDEVTAWTGANPSVTKEQSFTAIYAYGYPSLFKGKTLADLNGDWVFNIDYALKSYWHNGALLTAFMGDKFTLTGSSASGKMSAMNFVTSLDEEGILSLSFEDTVYKIKPIQQAGKGYLATTEKWVAGKLEYIVANSMAKFDDSYSAFTDNLVTQFPEVYLAYINGAIADMWDGDKLKLENVWGYKFSDDGTLYRGITGFDANPDNWDGIPEEHFYLGNSDWTWEKADNTVNMNHDGSGRPRQRTWEVISVDEQGRALVFEHSIRKADFNFDGEITADEYGQFIFPRINIQKKDDLSRWPTAWQNTLDAGFVPDESAPKPGKLSKLGKPSELGKQQRIILH
ncbi:MAG: cadherin-like domain-containing protein [Colwellia sp.]|nr:cadherin-like domain-containing protein [Colwellia sp.]